MNKRYRSGKYLRKNGKGLGDNVSCKILQKKDAANKKFAYQKNVLINGKVGTPYKEINS